MSAMADRSEGPEVLQTSAEIAGAVRERQVSSRRLYIVPRPSRPCEYCGKLMESPRADQRFCRYPRHRRPELGAPPAVRACDFCGELIDKPRRGQKFCRKPRRCSNYAAAARRFAPPAERVVTDSDRSVCSPAVAVIVEHARPAASLPAFSPASSASVFETTPMIGILIESMPAPGSSWAPEARAQWMAVLERTLDTLYLGDPADFARAEAGRE
jgi:hypothetical protein